MAPLAHRSGVAGFDKSEELGLDGLEARLAEKNDAGQAERLAAQDHGAPVPAPAPRAGMARAKRIPRLPTMIMMSPTL